MPDPGSEPDGGASLLFDFPLDLTAQEPADYRPAAVTNLFFWNNYLHDVSYHYGFTEAAGNFQENDYGRGGVGGDSVNADAQDGSGVDNSNFGTPPDGSHPRMQMFVWTAHSFAGGAAVTMTVNSPATIAGDYQAGGGLWGTDRVTADVAQPAGASTGCTAADFTGFSAGDIALIDRGTCGFPTKVRNAQAAGASGVIVANTQTGTLTLSQDGTPNQPTITVVSVSQADGAKFKANLPGVNATIGITFAHDRDSDLDNGVIAHEYMHGISNCLTGGPSTTTCLDNAEQGGEGWSDFMALVLTAKAGQTATTPRPLGTYVNFGAGIRAFPYTTDIAVNPQTYDAIKMSNGDPHFSGAVWAEMLWEVYWNLVNQYGFDPNIFQDYTHGGNNLALQLVMDGLKLQPCSPGFVDARDGILLADQNLTGGANQCLLWRAFAKRGLGENADQGSSNDTRDGTQDFTVPASACGPRATPDPTSLSSTLARGSSETKTLNVNNTGLAGADDLHWTISEAASACSSTSNLTWVSESATSETTTQGGSTPVSVTFNSTELTPGQTITGLLCLTSDDAAHPTVSIPLALLVPPAPTAVSAPIVTSDTAYVGADVTVSATLSEVGGGGLAGQTVDFAITDPSHIFTDVSSATGDNGVASATFTPTQRGPYVIVASFAGDASDVLSSSPELSLGVYQRVQLSVSGVNAVAGGPAGVSATLLTVPGGQPVAGEAVEISPGGSQPACSPITDANGVAGCPVTYNTPGMFTAQASFSDVGGFFANSDGSLEPAEVASGPVDVTAATPTVSTIQEPASAVVGSMIADKATVSGGDSPTGTVTFKLYSNPSGTGAPLFTDATESLVSGVATSKGYTATAAGTDYWVATYNGDSNNSPVSNGTAAEPVAITQATPTISTSRQETAATAGSSIADQAAVSGGFNPTGTVTFKLYSNPNATGTPLFTDANEPLVNRVATSKGYTATAAGTDYWVATYNGDSNNRSVTSATAAEPVTISSTVSSGGLTVTRGESLLIGPGARVGGSVNVQPGASLDLEGAAVAGSLTVASGAGSINACGATISGPVSITADTGLVTFGSSGSCAGNKISGSVQITGGTGTGVTFYKNTVSGSLTIIHNTGKIDIGTGANANKVSGTTTTKPNP